MSFFSRDNRCKGGQWEMNTGKTAGSGGKLEDHNSNNNSTYGTKLVWNSFKSTLRDPSKRREAVMDETT
jgi:hypothetical protein